MLQVSSWHAARLLAASSAVSAPVGRLHTPHELQVAWKHTQPQRGRVLLHDQAQPRQAVQERHKAGLVPGAVVDACTVAEAVHPVRHLCGQERLTMPRRCAGSSLQGSASWLPLTSSRSAPCRSGGTSALSMLGARSAMRLNQALRAELVSWQTVLRAWRALQRALEGRVAIAQGVLHWGRLVHKHLQILQRCSHSFSGWRD